MFGNTKYILYSSINKNLKKLKIKININKIKSTENTNKLNIENLDEKEPAILTYTSGTTGRPKVAVRTHEFLRIQGEILEKIMDYGKNDIEISTMPIFTLSNINSRITSIIADANFSELDKSVAQKIINQIIKNNANRMMASPGFLNLIIDYMLKNKMEIKQIEKIFTGGGAVFIDFLEKLKKVFPNAKVWTIYGSTEAEPIAKMEASNIQSEDIDKIENGYGILAGEILGVNSCKIIKTGISEIGEINKKEFEKLEAEIGEIVVEGENVLKGYLGGVGDKENKFKVDGKTYHRTGDIRLF